MSTVLQPRAEFDRLPANHWALNPLSFKNQFWPDVHFYKEQRTIVRSVRDNKETYVPAGNKLGKDFVGGFICLWFFLTRWPCRIVTTSAKEAHLRVLWGEINWFVQHAAVPLDRTRGGPLVVNQLEIKKYVNVECKLCANSGIAGDELCPRCRAEKVKCGTSYILGMVAGDDSIAAMGGHHAPPKVPDGLPHSMLFTDESSSVKDGYYDIAQPWFERGLFIGNAWRCDNFFKRNVKKGDLRIAL